MKTNIDRSLVLGTISLILTILAVPLDALAQCSGITPSTSCTGGIVDGGVTGFTTIQEAVCYQPVSATSECTIQLPGLPSGAAYAEDVVVNNGRNVRLEVIEFSTSSDWEVRWVSTTGGGYMVQIVDDSRLVLEGGAALTDGPGGTKGSQLHLSEPSVFSTKTATIFVESGSSLETENTVVSGAYNRVLQVQGSVTALNSAFVGSTGYTYGAGSALVAVEGSGATGIFTACEIRADRSVSSGTQWPHWRLTSPVGTSTSADQPDVLVLLKQGELTVRRSRDTGDFFGGGCAGDRQAPVLWGGEYASIVIDNGEGHISENDIYDTVNSAGIGVHFKQGTGSLTQNYLENSTSGGFFSGVKITEVSSGTNSILVENNIIRDASRGILIDSLVDADVVLRNNTIEAPGLTGFWFADDYPISVEANAITDITAFGAFWDVSIGGTPSMAAESQDVV